MNTVNVIPAWHQHVSLVNMHTAFGSKYCSGKVNPHRAASSGVAS